VIPSDDTIAAIATASGAAGLAVIRVSGPEALKIADAVFEGPVRLGAAASHSMHHGWAVWPEPDRPERPAFPDASDFSVRGPRGADRLDEVVAAVFRAPRSYTREDVVEISCHGGALPTRRILAALLAAGARLSRPGEFTLRAFLNGRLDLVQAEAVADLIQAETERARALALSQLSGELSLRLAALEERITDALCEVEARVDFAEDVGGIEVPEHVVQAIAAVDADLAALLAGAALARAVREGVAVPLVGRPNAGKSSLFNALLGEARAIVTPLPGTTRDRVSEAIEVAGVRVTLSDTAGMRDARDPIEALGVERTRAALADASVVVWVVDGATALEDADREMARELNGARVIVALNKCDLPGAVDPAEVSGMLNGSAGRVVALSAMRGDGLAALREAIAEALGADQSEGGAVAVSNARHVEALERAREALARACVASGEPGEIVALELRDALAAIGEVTGREVGEDVLDRIFGRFCIGK
jgi:tRNA modification GTPase